MRKINWNSVNSKLFIDRKVSITEATDEDLYDKVVELSDETGAVDDLVTFIAQVFNGGLEQYIDNGYGKKINSVRNDLRLIGGSKANELYQHIAELEPSPDKVKSSRVRGKSINKSWSDLEKWMYNDSFMDGLYKEILKKYPQGTGVHEAEGGSNLNELLSRVKSRLFDTEKVVTIAKQDPSFSDAEKKILGDVDRKLSTLRNHINGLIK